jgi:hypothetical protein
MTVDKSCRINPLSMHDVYIEGNMATIAETIPIDISKTPGVVDNIFVGADCTPEEIQIYIYFTLEEEMPGIDTRIVEHEIMNYPNIKKVQ